MIGQLVGKLLTIVFSVVFLYFGVRALRRKVAFVRSVRGTAFTDVADVDEQSVVKVSGVARVVDGTVDTPLGDGEALVYAHEEQRWESDEDAWETESEVIEAVPFQVEGADGSVVDVAVEPERVLTTDANTTRTFEGNPENADVGVGGLGVTVAETYEREVQRALQDGDDVVVYGSTREKDGDVVIGDTLGEEPLVVMDDERALSSVRRVILTYGATLLFVLFILVAVLWSFF